jgi:hypothetical protein
MNPIIKSRNEPDMHQRECQSGNNYLRHGVAPFSGLFKGVRPLKKARGT